MAYGSGYLGGYIDGSDPPVINVCAPIGWGGGPYGLMAYAGYELCSLNVENEILVTPNSNVRDLCIVRC